MTQPIGNPSHIGNLDASQLGPQPTYLPDDHPDVEAKQRIDAGEEPIDVAAALPASSLAWAELADEAHQEGRLVDAYASARVGYHRGLDALRAAGFLRALYALGRAAGAIGEGEEAARIEEFLASSDPTAVEAIGKGE